MFKLIRHVVVLIAALAAGLFVTQSAHAADSAAPGRLVVVQALPDEVLSVAIDGRTVTSDSALGSVLGPFSLTAGSHQVEFTDAAGTVRLSSTVQVAPGSANDLVVHRPAQVNGAPVINSYRTPQSPIGPGKARVLVAHTATVAPADVRVDGQVVFRDIANGEYATADVAAGRHTVALLPAGLDTDPILGPVSLDLQPGTVTMVYAVGDPKRGSMKVIVHRASLSSNGAAAPDTIDTGSAGLAAHIRVAPFSATTAPASASGSTGFTATSPLVLSAIAALGVGAGLYRRRHPGRHRAVRRG